ncbi:Protein OPI10 like protein [Verticillium longisporum]|nr:Protein OPI10 like protein [Verticillium longisporum]
MLFLNRKWLSRKFRVTLRGTTIMSSPLFGVIPTGQPLITEPTSTPSQTSFLYTISAARSFTHVVVFILPGIILPQNTAAAIYFATASAVAAAATAGQTPDFQFLGGIGPGKESAVFKINAAPSDVQGNLNGEQSGTSVMIGVSIEDATSVAIRIQEKKPNTTPTGRGGQPSTAVLAQRIIQNAFNFLSGFSGTAGPGGVEVVPLKAFEGWWKKFESRVRSDPSFLERQQQE